MTIFLRDKNNKTIIETEVYSKKYEDIDDSHIEILSTVDIQNYSLFLLDQKLSDQFQFISLIETLSELRGWLWEVYFNGTKNTTDHLDEVRKKVENFYREVSGKFDDLSYVTD